jgi:predicted adenine nucleotide alpha hydrolase (AANH) superfamily ATPase
VRILLHICCAPCTIYPLRILRGEGNEVSGLFHNPNIHPYLEYRKRLETVETYAAQEMLPVIREEGYHPEEYLRQVAFREEERCRYCYLLRLTRAAQIARMDRFDAFTTTLLYSRFQKHDLIRTVGEGVAVQQGIPFLYRDFREGWSEGVRISREIGMYRQPYCGCIYSERERFCRPSRKDDGRDASLGQGTRS